MRAYGEWRTYPVILKLGTGWRCVVNFTPRLLDPRETTLVLFELEARREVEPWTLWENRKFSGQLFYWCLRGMQEEDSFCGRK
jgi:hypothetical protein